MKLPYDDDEEYDNEFYGPMDGVRPADYPEVYRPLLQGICQTLRNGIRRFYKVTNQMPRLRCLPCGSQNPEGLTMYTGWHTLTNGIEYPPNCDTCRRPLLRSQAATDCPLCIEEYLEREEEFQPAVTMAVVCRW